MGYPRNEVLRWYAIRAREEIIMSRHFELLQRIEAEQPSAAPGKTLTPIPLRRANPGLLGRALDGEDVATQIQISRFVQQVFLGPEEAPKVVALLEAEAKGESSDICARSAKLLAAHLKEDICAIDCNYESPSLHSHFGISNTDGISEAISGSIAMDACLKATTMPNLFVVPAGRSGSPQDWSSQNVQAIFEQLHTEFAYILVNAPPVSQGGEGIMVGLLADAAVLIVKANSTTKFVARRAKELLQAAD